MIHNHFDISDRLLGLRTCLGTVDHLWSSMGTPTLIRHKRLNTYSHVTGKHNRQDWWALVWCYTDAGRDSEDYHFWCFLDWDASSLSDFSMIRKRPGESWKMARNGNVETLQEWFALWKVFRAKFPTHKQTPLLRSGSNLVALEEWVQRRRLLSYTFDVDL